MTAGALPKQKKHATVKNKKQREKAIKAAGQSRVALQRLSRSLARLMYVAFIIPEFAGKLDNKKASREARKVKKDTAKRLWE